MTETFAVSNDIIHHIRRIGSDADVTYCGISLAKQLPRVKVSFSTGLPNQPSRVSVSTVFQKLRQAAQTACKTVSVCYGKRGKIFLSISSREKKEAQGSRPGSRQDGFIKESLFADFDKCQDGGP